MKLNKYLKLARTTALRALLILVALITFGAQSAIALNAEQLKLFNSGTFWYDVQDGACAMSPSTTAPSGPTLGTGDKLYILGDSITVRTEPKYVASFELKGIETYINGRVGRSWTSAGQDGQTPQGTSNNGAEAIESDRDWIAGANGIVIALGSNGGVGGNPIDDIVTAVRAINPSAPIWWINTTYTADWSGADGSLGEFNAELAAKTGVTMIDWYKTVDAQGDPSVTPANDPNGLLEDGLHPNGTGTDSLANLVVTSVTSGSAPATGGASPTTPTTPGAGAVGGAYSATVWGATKTLPSAWVPILGKAGQRWGVDPAILAALLSIETSWPEVDYNSVRAGGSSNPNAAIGPFQFTGDTAHDFLPAHDGHGLGSYAATWDYTSRVVKAVNNGTEFDPDGSFAVDGDKDGKVDRANPEDAAMLAAVYLKDMGATSDMLLGEEGDYNVPPFGDANPKTVRMIGAWYNQGQSWDSSEAVQGQNDVDHYMDQMWEVTKAGRESGVFGGNYATSGTCESGGTSVPSTGDASEYIQDCGANNGNAMIACRAINELSGIRYPTNAEKAAGEVANADDPNPQILDCSGLTNMAIYRTYGFNPGLCSVRYRTDSNFEEIDVHSIQPGDLVGRGTICGTDDNGVSGHIAVVVSYDAATKKLITVEASSQNYPSGVRTREAGAYNVNLAADVGEGGYTWAVRYVGPKN